MRGYSRRLAGLIGQLGVLLLGAAVLQTMFMPEFDVWSVTRVSVTGVVCITIGSLFGGE